MHLVFKFTLVGRCQTYEILDLLRNQYSARNRSKTTDEKQNNTLARLDTKQNGWFAKSLLKAFRLLIQSGVFQYIAQ